MSDSFEKLENTKLIFFITYLRWDEPSHTKYTFLEGVLNLLCIGGGFFSCRSINHMAYILKFQIYFSSGEQCNGR